LPIALVPAKVYPPAVAGRHGEAETRSFSNGKRAALGFYLPSDDIENRSPLDLLRRHSISTVTLEDEHQQQDHNNQADDENDADKTSEEF
jgi:hypothetical protein